MRIPSPLALALACFVASGCGAPVVAPTYPTTFPGIIASALAEAEAGGAGEAQLAILRQAAADGEISIESARAAARAAVQCMSDGGIYAAYHEDGMKSGLVIPGYIAGGGTADQMSAQDVVITACDNRESFWVNSVYQGQPTSVAVNDAYLDQQVPIVRSCLERSGYHTDPDATTHEVLRQALDVAQATSFELNCLGEAEIESF